MISVNPIWDFVFVENFCLVRALLGPPWKAPCVLSMWTCKTKKKNSHPPRSVLYYFATPPIKLKPLDRQQNRWGGLLIANHLNQSVQYDEPIKNTEQQSDPIYYTLFCRWHAVAMCSPATTAKYAIIMVKLKNQFPEPNQTKPNRYVLIFLHPILLCRSYIEHCCCCRCSQEGKLLLLPDGYYKK